MANVIHGSTSECAQSSGPPQSVEEHERFQQARRAALKGKKMLVVGGAAYPEKHTIFELGKELGLQMTVIDADTSKVKDLIKDSIIVKLDDPAVAVPQAIEKLDAYIKEHGAFDGIITFWEDEVPITAALAEHLRLPYHSVAAVTAARSKGNTRQAMKDAGLPTPDFHVLESRADLEAALKTVSYPMILKPAYGIEAMSVIKVHDKAEARAAYEKIYKEIDPKNDPIYNQGRQIVFEEYFDGDEVDVDILLQNGAVVFNSITDNWATVEPYFIPKGSTLPSRMPRDKQQEMIELSIESAKALGFTDGVLHIEGKYTSRGPRLLEVNARMGGLWVRDWVKTVWGVDMAEEQLFLAAGVPIAPRKSPEPLKHLAGEFFLPSASGIFEGIEEQEALKLLPGFYRLLLFKELGQQVLVPPQGYQRLGMLSAQGLTPQEAMKLFKALRKKLRPRIRPLD
jgi:carnosine synthase